MKAETVELFSHGAATPHLTVADTGVLKEYRSSAWTAMATAVATSIAQSPKDEKIWYINNN
jgi:hypothetical protein